LIYVSTTNHSHAKKEFINAFYDLTISDLQSLIESKLNEDFVYNHKLCSVFGCENVYNSNCPQLLVFVNASLCSNICLNFFSFLIYAPSGFSGKILLLC